MSAPGTDALTFVLCIENNAMRAQALLLCASIRQFGGRRPLPLPLVHVHYHWLFADPYHDRALAALRNLGADRNRLDWLTARLPLQ